MRKIFIIFLIMAMITTSCSASSVLPSSTDGTGYDSAGYPNTYKNTGDYAADLVGVAETQIGYHEAIGVGDHTKYSTWFFGKDTEYAWCGIFVSWCARQAGIPQSVIRKNMHVYYATADTYKQNDNGWRYFGGAAYEYRTYEPVPGDLFFSDTTDDEYHYSTHAGIVERVDSKYIYTIEGNTKVYDDNSGQYIDSVARRKYLRSNGYMILNSGKVSGCYHILFFVHPDY